MGIETVRSMELFQYEESGMAALSAWEGLDALATDARPSPAAAGEPATVHRSEQEIAEEVKRGFDAGRQQGIQEGRQAEREALAATRSADEKRRAEQVTGLVQRFAEDREQYLRAVEHEVVTLALGVAARILRREAQMDPLLLTGAVRVALGQLSNSTEVLLRVPAAELDLWREAIAHLPNLTVKPTVQAGDGMRTGDCVIETTVGSVDIGIRTQLSEIERGFFDRAGQRPPVPSTPAERGLEHTA